MEKWFDRLIQFLNNYKDNSVDYLGISHYFDNRKIEDIIDFYDAINAIDGLYALLSTHEKLIKDQAIPLYIILEIYKKNPNNVFYNYWNIWIKFFISLSDTEYSEFWNDFFKEKSQRLSGNNFAIYISKIPEKIFNICFLLSNSFSIIFIIVNKIRENSIINGFVILENVFLIFILGGFLGIILSIIIGSFYLIATTKKGP